MTKWIGGRNKDKLRHTSLLLSENPTQYRGKFIWIPSLVFFAHINDKKDRSLGVNLAPGALPAGKAMQ